MTALTAQAEEKMNTEFINLSLIFQTVSSRRGVRLLQLLIFIDGDLRAEYISDN